MAKAEPTSLHPPLIVLHQFTGFWHVTKGHSDWIRLGAYVLVVDGSNNTEFCDLKNLAESRGMDLVFRRRESLLSAGIFQFVSR